MKLTKNQILIIAVLIVGVIIYFMFFRKKGSGAAKTTVKEEKDKAQKAAEVATKAAEVATTAAAKAESAYDGIYEYGKEDAMRAVSGRTTSYLESSYDGLPKFVAPKKPGNWLAY